MLNVFELMAKLGLDTSSYEKSLSDSEKKGSSFGSGLKSAAKIAAGAIAAGSAAVVAFGTQSVKAGMDFDKSMAQVAATMGTTVDSISNLREFAQKMGATTAFSATQAANALNYMALAGYDADKSMAMLPNVLNLAAAGNIDLAEASDMVTDAQSALGLSTKQTTQMVDQMAMASSKSNTSVAQLGQAILTIGATARNIKGGTAELATILGVLADNGIKGGEGGTHLRNIMMSLTKPTDTAAASLEKLGVKVYDSEGNMRSMIDIIGDLQKATANMSQEAKDSAIGEIFNRADMASVNALLNTTQERYKDLSTQISNAAGASEKMANTQLDNLSGDVTLFKSALEGAQIAISDKLTPQLRSFVQLGSKGLSDITLAFKEGGLSGAFSAFGTWLSGAIEMLVQYVPEIVKAAANLLGAFVKGIIDNAGSIIDGFTQILLDLANWLSDEGNVKTMIDGIVQLVSKLVNSFAMVLPVLLPAIVTLIAEIAKAMTSPDNVQLLLDAVLTIVGALAVAIWNSLPILGKAVLDIIKNLGELLGRFFEWAVPIVADGIEAIVNKVKSWGKAIKDFVVNLINGIKTTISTWITNLKTAFVDGFNFIKDSVANIVKKVGEFVGDLLGKIKELPSKVVSLGSDVVKGLWNGISNMSKWIAEKIKGFGKGVVDGLKKFFKISSPSKLFRDEIGKFLAMGIGEGFEDTLPDTIAGMKDSLADMTTNLNEVAVPVNATAEGGSAASGNSFVLNIYGAEGQDVRTLAKLVSQEIQNLISNKEKVYA